MFPFSRIFTFFYLTVVFFLWLQPACASPADTGTAIAHDPLTRFFEESDAYVKFRYRFENVDQDGFSKDANASTLRSVFGLKSAEVYGLKGHVEVEDVSELGPDTFNNTINGVTDRPIVVDVDGTEINILTLAASHIPDSTVLAGRYHKVLDNARFIGDVVWRQNHQTFDGATFTNTTIEDLELFYGYMWNVNRIFGEDSPVGDIDSANHLFHATVSSLETASISLYSYLLDLEDLAVASSRTFGGLVSGSYPPDSTVTLLYDIEYAHQSDYGNNPTPYDAQYYRVGAGVGYNDFSVSGGLELLGSDNGTNAFSTPLATLHAWNGWADVFLTTPNEGLQDSYGKLSYVHDKWSETFGRTFLELAYHQFYSDQGNTRFGTEWDVNFVQNFLEKYYFGVKVAHYNADNFAVDTTKVIFSLGAEFTTTS